MIEEEKNSTRADFRRPNRSQMRHQPSKAELDEPIHLPGLSPEDVAKIVTQGGASRRKPEKAGD